MKQDSNRMNFAWKRYRLLAQKISFTLSATESLSLKTGTNLKGLFVPDLTFHEMKYFIIQNIDESDCFFG